MFRSMSRVAAVSVVALALVLSFVPAAQASPLGAGPSLDIRAGWFEAAISWLSGLVFGEESSSPAPKSSFEAIEYAPSDEDYGSLQSGGCIDPEGRPRPACF